MHFSHDVYGNMFTGSGFTKSMRDKDDLPQAKTVLVIGEGAIQPIELEDGSDVIPLSHTVTNDDDTQTTCSIVGITDFEELVNTIYPDLLSVDHSAYNDRGNFSTNKREHRKY